MIEGYAAVFNSLSEDLGGFREQIAPGAFSKTIRGNKDIVALFNHDPNLVLGRTGNGTLTLREDDIGLRMEVRPPNTSTARDILENIRRGDVTGQSFSFATVRDEFSDPERGKEVIRTLREVRLFDVGPVVFPAYRDTMVSARALEEVQTRNGHLHPEPSAPEVNADPEPAAEPEGPAHSEVTNPAEPTKTRKVSVLVKEWRLEVEAGADMEVSSEA